MTPPSRGGYKGLKRSSSKPYINDLHDIFQIDLEGVKRRGNLKSLDFKLYITLLNRVD